MYITDTLKGCFGGKTYNESHSNVVTNWTPNNVRTVIITTSYILIGYHTKRSTLTMLDSMKFQEDFSKGNVPNAIKNLLCSRQLSCLEEIYSSQEILDVQQYANSINMGNSRLRAYGFIGNINPNDLKALIDSAFTGRDCTFTLYNTMPNNLQYKVTNNPDWFSHIYLRPQFYKLDAESGTLSKMLHSYKSKIQGILENQKLESQKQSLSNSIQSCINNDLENLDMLTSLIKTPLSKYIEKGIEKFGYQILLSDVQNYIKDKRLAEVYKYYKSISKDGKSITSIKLNSNSLVDIFNILDEALLSILASVGNRPMEMCKLRCICIRYANEMGICRFTKAMKLSNIGENTISLGTLYRMFLGYMGCDSDYLLKRSPNINQDSEAMFTVNELFGKITNKADYPMYWSIVKCITLDRECYVYSNKMFENTLVSHVSICTDDCSTILTDALNILNACKSKSQEVSVVDDRSVVVAKVLGIPNVNRVDLGVALGTLGIGILDSSTEEYLEDDETEYIEEDSGWGSDEDEFLEEDEIEYIEDDSEEGYSEEGQVEEEYSEEEPQPEEVLPEVDEEQLDDSKVLQFYAIYYNSIVDELIKRYTGIFSSGYELKRPFGIITSDGCASLSSSVMKYVDVTSSTIQMYSIFANKLGLQQQTARSNKQIANVVYQAYMSGGTTNLYFPFKMLEFAYGRLAPTGDNQNSLNTYTKSTNGSNWGTYKTEMKKSIERLVKVSTLSFIERFCTEGIDYKSQEAINNVRQFLLYLQKCLSYCILLVDYKVIANKPSKFKLRVCDPERVLGTYNYTKDIINIAFVGGTGAVPYSSEPRFVEEAKLCEYSHEFNHNISQAMPLFAYKAFDLLKSQGIEPTWDNMILGMFEDDTVLRNGTHGVSMSQKLTHMEDAGSRAGKGVMTLNLLISAIYTGKTMFYLDRKPDMASLLKNICPEMFVVNGAAYSQVDDSYQTFANRNSLVNANNIPKEVLEILNCQPDWDSLGDLFYMRALKLVVGIIMARGKCGLGDKEEFGGEKGILLVTDEFKNFQEGFSKIVDKFFARIPGDGNKRVSKLSKLNAELEKKESGKANEYEEKKKAYDLQYNNTNYYALSYLNSLVKDLEFADELRDASFATSEVSRSDIFVIGQHIEHKALPFKNYRDILQTGRYALDGGYGLPKTSRGDIDIVKESFPYSLVMFKTADAFFGRNHEDGREKYLAQKDSRSKACGRLDDKAGNFAYIADFNESVRRQITEDKGTDNIQIANKAIYFKPFLVLNDCTEQYTGPMFRRCKGDEAVPWVTPEEIIYENPDENDPSKLNKAIGFEQYLIRTGITNYKNILVKGTTVANHALHCMGYQGTWLDFITDLRPEWLFTIEDVVNGCAGKQMPLNNLETNPVTKEYYEFLHENSGNSSGEGTLGEDSDFYKESAEDFANADEGISDSNKLDSQLEKEIPKEPSLTTMPNDIWSDLGSNTNESFEEYTEHQVNSFNQPQQRFTLDDETNFNQSYGKQMIDDEVFKKVEQALNTNDPYVTGYTVNPEEFKQDSPVTSFGEEIGRVDYEKDINSLADMVEVISKDVIKKFGGLDRFYSLKVKGGALIVDGYYYRCQVKDMYANNIPYDIRREINSGNISKLFDYSYIRKMPKIRDLEFDSVSFVYDLVSSALGYGSYISVDRFFKDFKALQVLTIGEERFTRKDYMEKIKDNDLFYHRKQADIYAEVVQNTLGNVSKNSWDWTKRAFTNKNSNIIFRGAKGIAGVGITATSGIASLGTRLSRKVPSALRALKGGIDNLFNG